MDHNRRADILTGWPQKMDLKGILTPRDLRFKIGF